MEQRGQESRGRFLVASETYGSLITYAAPPGDARVLLSTYQPGRVGEKAVPVGCWQCSVLSAAKG